MGSSVLQVLLQIPLLCWHPRWRWLGLGCGQQLGGAGWTPPQLGWVKRSKKQNFQWKQRERKDPTEPMSYQFCWNKCYELSEKTNSKSSTSPLWKDKGQQCCCNILLQEYQRDELKKNKTCQLKQLSSNPKIHASRFLKKLQENIISETKENRNYSIYLFEFGTHKLNPYNLPTFISLNQTI